MHCAAALFFFFSSRRRHTRLQGDWSSDVCSSDLSLWRPTGCLRRPWSSPCAELAAGRVKVQVPASRPRPLRQRVPRQGLDIQRRLRVYRKLSQHHHGLWDLVARSEEHTSELQSPCNLVCRLLLEK